ncbi:MAG: lipid-A-disaccharide synthase [Okeania sp. SIO3I5]|uniref:lipid-A-disaccharide synthase n=1 Tax=Okeania sp. SIO3I5 TaxID=2607805 RepID=UPI0013B7EEB1|nr:lipid-A-disaccharide synthase [Okeania sp. SIO3I5]NEQ39779.1 lipid-A-disaccharide synthase [Okeania sp. SIO3I5]
MTPIKIFISTGEVSGDLQGALLVEALYRQAQLQGLNLDIVALGGARMAAAGATLLENTTKIGSVGIIESLPFVFPTLKVQQKAKEYLHNESPNIVVLIDYMGPNLSIGNYIRKTWLNLPIIWYIAPQEWVWSLGKDKTTKIVNLTDKLLAIFPGEANYFRQQGADVTWVGHPIIDRIKMAPTREKARSILGIDTDTLAIALLPASRQQEVKYLMPIMFRSAQIIQAKLPQVHFLIPLSLEIYRYAIEEAIKKYQLKATIYPTLPQKSQEILESNNLEILAGADLAIAKSGTVNLEIALLNVPQVVIYKVNPITVWIARNILRFSIPFMSPPNLVQMKSIVPELFQENATPDNIVSEALELLLNSQRRAQTLADYQEMRQSLGEEGVGDRAAQVILDLVLT